MDLQQAQKLALSLMSQYGITQSGWRFKYDNSHLRFGVCKFGPKIIGLSKRLVLVNDEERVKDTILHEIAHALTPGHHHDHVWRAKAIEIGCTGERCFTEETTNIPETRYIGTCPNGHTHQRHKSSSKKQSCGKCSSRFSYDYIITWKLNPNYN